MQRTGFLLRLRPTTHTPNTPTPTANTLRTQYLRRPAAISGAVSVVPALSSRWMSTKNTAPSSHPDAKNTDPKASSPSDTEGMDLFSRALAAERERVRQAAASQQQQQQQDSMHGQQQASSQQDESGKAKPEEEMSPEEEEERRKRWEAHAAREEEKLLKSRSRWTMGGMLIGTVAMYGYLGLPDEKDKEQGWAAHNARVLKNLSLGYSSAVDPASDKLLPDPLPEPYQRPYTLCLELNDSLVHLVWDKDYGWRVATRPGVKQFLSYLSRYYEIVIFTSSQNYIAQPIIETLDPYHYIMYSLYRDSTKLLGTHHVKDISCLNRDIGKVIVVDTDKENFQLQPENGIVLKTWKGEEDDIELPKLMKFLEELALLATVANVQDIRPILQTVKQLDENDIYNGWTLRKEQLEQFSKDVSNKQQGASSDASLSSSASASAASSTMSWISNYLNPMPVVNALFGRGLQGGGDAGSSGKKLTSPASMSLMEFIEQAGKEEYAAFLKDQKEAIKQMEEQKKKMEEEQRRQIQEMKDKKMKMFDYMSGAAAVPGAPGAPGSSTSSA